MPAPAPARPLVVASNRGPVSFATEGDRLVPRRGGGGLVSALSGALRASGGTWVAAAMSEGDREAARRAGGRFPAGHDDPFELRYLDIEPATFDGAYNGIANRVLWFCHHRLWDVPFEPSFDEGTERDWRSYEAVNGTFAEGLIEEGAPRPGAAFLIQDYHLTLVPEIVRSRAADAAVLHFSHSPFAGPDDLSMLPAELWSGVLRGMLGADVVAFHASAWADRFVACCRELLGAKADRRGRTIAWDGRTVRVGVHPIGIDVSALRAEARSEEVRSRLGALERAVGERRVILRADRVEPSKNVVRGFRAYAALLRGHPEWRGGVVFVACLYPSREDLSAYRRYADACRDAAREVNDEFGDDEWEPVALSIEDDLLRVLAAYQRYDVLFVNPVADGMNLVAKEGPVLNRREGAVVLSRRAGAFEELGRDVVAVNPFDEAQMAEALHEALSMSADERGRRARALRRRIGAGTPARWIDRQLRELETVRPR